MSILTKKSSRSPFRLRLSAKWQGYLTAYWMILPSFILYAGLIIYPLFQGLFISFNQWDGLSAMKWIGLKNYGFVLKDAVFWLALKNTFIFAIGVTVVKNIFGLMLALLLNQELRGRTFFRAAAFIPVTFAFVVIGVLWSWIYNPTFGLINNLLQSVGLSSLIRGWLSDTKIALYSVMFVDIWKWTGFHMVLFLAGLQGISQEYYEVAEIDGAGSLQKFRYITIPLLNQVIAVSVIMSMLGAFVSNYDVVYVMTGGGPMHATEVALTWIVSTTFRFAAVGKANAMSMVLFVFVSIFGIAQLYFMTRNNVEA
jgi:raffinose/stachyose/melibiose transport system permease protein